jgi:hypothetical protein
MERITAQQAYAMFRAYKAARPGLEQVPRPDLRNVSAASTADNLVQMKKTDEYLRRFRVGILSLAAAFPWLNPYEAGLVVRAPLVVSAACALVLWSTTVTGYKPSSLPTHAGWASLVVAVWAALSQGEILGNRNAGGRPAACAAGRRFRSTPHFRARSFSRVFSSTAAISAVLGLCQYLGIASNLPFG